MQHECSNRCNGVENNLENLRQLLVNGRVTLRSFESFVFSLSLSWNYKRMIPTKPLAPICKTNLFPNIRWKTAHLNKFKINLRSELSLYIRRVTSYIQSAIWMLLTHKLPTCGKLVSQGLFSQLFNQILRHNFSKEDRIE